MAGGVGYRRVERLYRSRLSDRSDRLFTKISFGTWIVCRVCFVTCFLPACAVRNPVNAPSHRAKHLLSPVFGRQALSVNDAPLHVYRSILAPCVCLVVLQHPVPVVPGRVALACSCHDAFVRHLLIVNSCYQTLACLPARVAIPFLCFPFFAWRGSFSLLLVIDD